MKDLLKGLLWLFGACLVFPTLIVLGFIYNFFYSFWLSYKKWYSFFLFWIKMIDGYLSVAGYIFKHIGIGIDMLGNVNGELLEDIVTPMEQTHFGDKNITVSASLGEIETKGWKLSKFGTKLSIALNWFFNEKSHTKYAWEYYLLRNKFQNSKQKNNSSYRVRK